jgi:hypothetical protein
LIGEYAKAEKWKKRIKLFELLVIVGVAGELFADGGIFLFSAHLQTISDREIAVIRDKASQQELRAAGLEKAAADTQREAENARRTADSFELDIAKAKKESANALERAAKAEENLGSTRKDAAVANERAAKAEQHAAEANKKAEDERTARLTLEAKIAPRRISSEQEQLIKGQLVRFKTWQITIFIVSGIPETGDFAGDFEKIFRNAGFAVEMITGIVGGTPRGISATFGRKRAGDLRILAQALIDSGLIIGPLPVSEDDKKPDLLQLTIDPK